MKNKKMLFAAIALALVIALMAGIYWMTRPEAAAGQKQITITVVHGDGSTRVVEVKTQEEFLGPVLLAEQLVDGEMAQYGLVIYAVDGEAASWEENQSYWAILIGEEYATTGADGVALTDGGSYSLVYTIG